VTTGRVVPRWCLVVLTAFLMFTGGADPAGAQPAGQPPGATSPTTVLSTPGAPVRPVEEEEGASRPLWVGAVVGGGGAVGLAFALWRAPAGSPGRRRAQPDPIDRR
jgi:hypothetical protein